MDSRRVNDLSGHNITPQLDVRVEAILKNAYEGYKTQKIGTWNVQTMMKTEKL